MLKIQITHRHHMGRQARSQLPLYLLRVGPFAAGNQPDNELPVVRSRDAANQPSWRNSSLSNAWQAQQYLFNLTRLDALPADLELIVGVPQVLHNTIMQLAGDVFRAVHPLSRGKRVGDKADCRQIRTLQVPHGKLYTAEP